MKSQVLLGDARHPERLGIAAGSVDCIVTSPPYWNLKLYGSEIEGEIGHGQTLASYLADMEQVFRECLRLVKDTGVMWVVADTLRYPRGTVEEYELFPLPMRLAELASGAGWRFHDIVIWRKNKTLPFSGAGKLRNLVEYVLLLTKSREFKHRPYRLAERHQPTAEWLAGWPERYHPLGRNPSNIWDVPIPTQGMWAHAERLHFCPLPADLVRRCVDLTSDPGDVVLDPFAGIGTVPAQAEAMGRRGLGIELNPEFIEVFESKTRQEFLATWEEGARTRQLSREDQASEAALILRLRALKAGKELKRYLERLAQGRPAHHAAAKVQSVIVRPDLEPEGEIDVLRGESPSLPVHLLVVAEAAEAQQTELGEILEGAVRSAALGVFRLDLHLVLVEPAVVDGDLYLVGWPSGHAQRLYEFDISRHGAFTEPPIKGLFPALPRLLTTIGLGPPVHPAALSPLGEARAEGERKLLQSLLGSGMSQRAMAQRLRLPLVELDELLRRHGLASSALAFAVPLPDDLRERAEQREP